MLMFEAKLFSEENYKLAEAPFYDPRYDRLSWVDIIDGKLYTMTVSSGEKHCFDFGEPIGAAVPMKDSDGFLVAGTSAIWKYEDEKKEILFGLTDELEPYQRANDAKADPEGRLFFGSISDDGEHSGGKLYRFDNDSLYCIQNDTKISNGMAWSSDKKKFFFSDSLEHAVFSYDYDAESGTVSGKKVLFEISNGVPDGMCIDNQDRLWLAVWDGNRIECRNSATGELEAIVNVSAKRTSSCCFYGENFDKLFITSAGVGLQGEYEGRLYKCDVKAVGKAPDYAVTE